MKPTSFQLLLTALLGATAASTSLRGSSAATHHSRRRLAPADNKSMRMFIKVNDTDAFEQQLLSTTLDYRSFNDLPGYMVVQGEPAALKELAKSEAVVESTDDRLRHVLVGKPSNHEQPKQTLDYGLALISAIEAHGLGYTGAGITVCVVDTGMDITHPDIDPSKFSGGGDYPWNAEGYSHGTHVTGIIAAENNEIGLRGAAYGATIMVQRVFDDFANGVYESTVLQAVEDCADAGADIINLSIGGFGYGEEEAAFYQAIRDRGILIFAAAGNQGRFTEDYPASYDAVISVGAIDANKDLASFSNRNTALDLVAPGVSVYSLMPTTLPCYGCDGETSGYGYMDGTSMASPYAAAAAALVWSAKPAVTADEVQEALLETTEYLGSSTQYGKGLVSAYGAIQYLLGVNSNDDQPVNDDDNVNADDVICADFTVSLTTDRWGHETTATLVHNATKSVIWGFGPLQPYTTYTWTECLDPSDCHILTVADSDGDGSCCQWGNGGFSAWWQDGDRYDSDGQYGYGVSVLVGSCPSYRATASAEPTRAIALALPREEPSSDP